MKITKKQVKEIIWTGLFGLILLLSYVFVFLYAIIH